MATEMENLIDQLELLVKINIDRTKGYSVAARDVEDPQLKALFEKLEKESEGFADDLGQVLKKYKQTPPETGTTAARFHQFWIDIKDKLLGKDRDAILSSCETGDETALATYTEALAHEKIQTLPDIQILLEGQQTIIAQDLMLIQSLRNEEKNISQA